MRMWRNRQTRWIQVPVVATPCGFKSHHPHQNKERHLLGVFFILVFYLNEGGNPDGFPLKLLFPSGFNNLT